MMVAAAGLPEEDPTDVYLRVLAACVRLSPEGDRGLSGQPAVILQAALVLCPEAPRAGLMEMELATRG
ncbi:hypothetical protein ACPW96_23085 [Micromonospora sp. DT81.3]|uniref:hypothetical protein n=1 Tax=Micromonospora sp. DT81.3 TaxID=3416523 RepID=UPI003CF012F4